MTESKPVKRRTAQALDIKAAALRAIEAEGVLMQFDGIIVRQLNGWRGLNLWHTPNDGLRVEAWQKANGIEPTPPLTDILDVWPVDSNKVFSMRWNAAGLVEVGTFKRGDWEALLLAA